jgi:hypothetical protein
MITHSRKFMAILPLPCMVVKAAPSRRLGALQASPPHRCRHARGLRRETPIVLSLLTRGGFAKDAGQNKADPQPDQQ